MKLGKKISMANGVPIRYYYNIAQTVTCLSVGIAWGIFWSTFHAKIFRNSVNIVKFGSCNSN